MERTLWLGVESSCDESALAVFSPDSGLKAELVSSQVSLHREYGGVVPDLASREHLRNFPLLCDRLRRHIPWDRIDRVAVTNGPGLAGCLALGTALAKSLAFGLGVPLLGVNHLRGHAFSPFIGLHAEDPASFAQRFQAACPHLGLLVSGGNTVLFSLEENGRVTPLAATVDDAAGEALDKGAKLLGLPYPGGPLIEKRAAGGDPEAFAFPRAFPRSEEKKFSFSGLKTSLRYRLEKMDETAFEAAFPALCASYQRAVVEALVHKTRQILAEGEFRSLGLSGGVANNRSLRASMSEAAADAGVPLLAARPEHTGDNAAMIAFAAWADPAAPMAETGNAVTIHPARSLTEV